MPVTSRKAFMAAGDALRQTGRLLRVIFPNNDGPEAVLAVNTLFAQEELSRGFRFDVELLSDDVSMPLKAMIGKMMTVSLVRDDGSERFFNGYVTEFRYMKTDGGFVYYYAVLEPWLAFARLRKDCVSFKGRSVIEMTGLVFAHYPQHDWKTCLQGDDPKVSYMNQYNETDYNHLHRRWEAAGLYYWYEHRADGHTLWLSDDSTMADAVDPCGLRDVEPGTIPYRAFGGSYERDGINQWQAIRRMGSGATAVASFDYKRPVPYVASRDSENHQGDEVPPYELYENLGEYAYRTGREGEALARRRMEEADRMTQYFEAKGNDRSVMPGRAFMLTEHHSSTMKWPIRNVAMRDPIGKREYLIIGARHWAGNNINSSDQEPSYYKNELTCQRKSIRWRPGRNYHSEPPPAPGLQTATVTGPEGEEIYTDSYGRVKVQFHWDRLGKRDDNSSAWVRVAMPMAGGEFGQIGVPRVGQEVVVQFLAENPDRPIITGVVYNERHKAPWKLPEERALAGLRSREVGGMRGNQLVLDDTKGEIQAQLRSDHLDSQLSLGDIHRLDTTAGHLERRGEGFELRTDGHGVMRAAQGVAITTEARPAGAGGVKAMPDTLQRLAQAQGLHESMAKIAQQQDPQDAGAQGDSASALAKQNEGIKGSEPKLPELSSPHLVFASSAGIAATAAQSVHVASGEQLAFTSAQNVSVAAYGGLFASVRQGLRMFVHKIGMKLIASSGDVDIQALSNSINLLAKLNITQSASRITITAKDEIVLNGAGSYIKLGAAGIEQGSKGKVTIHGAMHEFLGPKNLNVANTMPPQSELQGKAMFNLGSHAAASGRPQAGVPYKLYKDGSIVEEGKLDETGSFAFEHEIDADSKYTVELPSGDTYDIEAGEQLAPHQVSSGMGHHGYQPSGPSLTNNAASLEEDRLLSNPAMRDIS